MKAGSSIAVSLLNMGVRGLALVGRFGLTIYLARYFSLHDVGLFGLLLGITGMTPPFIGFGLNFFVSREIIGEPLLVAGVKIRDRLVVTCIMLALSVGAVFCATALGLFPLLDMPLLIICVVVLETVAFEFHAFLINRGMALTANWLLFVRSAAWVFPVIVCGIYFPGSRSITVIIEAWLAGLLVFYGSLAAAFRRWPLRAIWHTTIDWAWLTNRIGRGWLIYVSDIGLAGAIFLDRYVVNYFLGIKLTGLYILYWSLANAVHNLVTTGVIQISLPQLVMAFKSDLRTWVLELRRAVASVFAFGVPICVGIFIVAQFVAPRLGITRFSGHPLLFGMMLLGTMVRLTGDMVSYGLYSSGRDRSFAIINIAGLLIAVAVAAALISALGLNGAGLAMICTPIILLVARLMVLRATGAVPSSIA